MQQLFHRHLAFLAVILVTGSTFATEPEFERPWTLMVYAATDNNAEEGILQFLDSIRVALDNDAGMELILWIDRSEGFSDDASSLGADFTGARVYRLRKDTAELLDASAYFDEMNSEGEFEANSADPRNIGRFVAFCKDEFPAQRYGLMIFSHANGVEMCPDEQAGQRMSIPALAHQVGEEASVDFLALELCSMAGIEIAYEWRPGNGGFSAEVLLAIPNAGSPLDWHRAFARIRSTGHATTAEGSVIDPATMTAEDFGRLVVEEGGAGREAGYAAYAKDHDMSGLQGDDHLRESVGCFNLRAAEAVKTAVDRLAVLLADSNAKDAFGALRGPSDALQILHYASKGRFLSQPYVDLYDLLDGAAGSSSLTAGVRAAATTARDAVDVMILSSYGMEAGFVEGFRAGRNGIFIVFPDGDALIRTPDKEYSGWSRHAWYTPLAAGGDSKLYGRWAFLSDGATAGNGKVENWFELLDFWFDDRQQGPEGTNRYAW